MKCATFVLSTGRCGTQWLADTLSSAYSDELDAVHEPLWEPYQPKRFLADYKSGREPRLDPLLRRHLDSINSSLIRKHHFEAGWPCFGAIPYLPKWISGPVKVIHVVRHPANVAASLCGHDVYDRGDWSKALALTPFDEGIEQTELAAGDRWASLDDFEKCLFWWTEINAWGLRLSKEFDPNSWLTVKFEDLFSGQGDTLKAIVEFLSLPFNSSCEERIGCTVDNFPRRTTRKLPPLWVIERYPKLLEVMAELGYSIEECESEELAQRYGGQEPGLFSRLVRAVRGKERKRAK